MTNRDLCYRKGFPSKDAVAAFQAIVTQGKVFDINAHLPNDTERRQVDADVFGTSTPDLAIYQSIKPKVPAVGSTEFEADAAFVIKAAAARDTPFEELEESEFPRPMREVSWFMQDITLFPYQAGVDYMTDLTSWDLIQRGFNPTVSPVRETTAKAITNGRAAATFVHDDDPIAPWIGAVAKMMSLGIPYRKEGELEQYEGQSFASWGVPFFYGLLGDTLRRVGLISFRHKWAEMVPRPEQYCQEQMGQLCSQAFPEGSPMHPSQNAMHSAVAIGMKALLENIFEMTAELPSGNTVGDELNLMADNIGMWRTWAGVHYTSDHDAARPRAEAIGKKIAAQALT